MKFSIANPFAKIEERPTPKEVYNWRIYFTAACLAGCAMEIGYDSGFIGGTLALPSFRDEFGISEMTESGAALVIANIISVFHAGCFFGSLFSYYFSYKWGRKLGLIVSAVVMGAGAVIMCIASKSTGLVPLYLGRVLAGIGVGFATAIVPVFLAEESPSPIRGRVSSCFEVGWRIGDTVGFFISYGVDSTIEPGKKQWFIPFAIQLIPAGLYLIGVFFLHESPRWLVTKGQEEKALKNLCILRNLPVDHEYIEWEMGQIKEDLEQQKSAVGLGFFDPWKEIMRRKNIQKRLLITLSLYFLQSLLGIQSINYYAPTIFKQVGIKSTNISLLGTGLFGIDKLFATIFWALFIVEQFGRRTTLLITSPVCAICFFYIGAYIKMGDGGAAGSAALAMLYIFAFFFIIGWSGTPYIVGAEIFDNNIRMFCQAINSMSLWLGVFLMTRFTGQMIQKMEYGIFFFFAGWAIFSIPFVFFLLPETKGISLEHMDRLFALPPWSAHKTLMAELTDENLAERTVNAYRGQDQKDEVDYVEFLDDSRKSQV